MNYSEVVSAKFRFPNSYNQDYKSNNLTQKQLMSHSLNQAFIFEDPQGPIDVYLSS